MNGEYIKAMDMDRYMDMAMPYIKSVVTRDCKLDKIAELAKTRIEVFPDIPDLMTFSKKFQSMILVCILIKK